MSAILDVHLRVNVLNMYACILKYIALKIQPWENRTHLKTEQTKIVQMVVIGCISRSLGLKIHF